MAAAACVICVRSLRHDPNDADARNPSHSQGRPASCFCSECDDKLRETRTAVELVEQLRLSILYQMSMIQDRLIEMYGIHKRESAATGIPLRPFDEFMGKIIFELLSKDSLGTWYGPKFSEGDPGQNMARNNVPKLPAYLTHAEISARRQCQLVINQIIPESTTGLAGQGVSTAEHGQTVSNKRIIGFRKRFLKDNRDSVVSLGQRVTGGKIAQASSLSSTMTERGISTGAQVQAVTTENGAVLTAPPGMCQPVPAANTNTQKSIAVSTNQHIFSGGQGQTNVMVESSIAGAISDSSTHLTAQPIDITCPGSKSLQADENISSDVLTDIKIKTEPDSFGNYEGTPLNSCLPELSREQMMKNSLGPHPVIALEDSEDSENEGTGSKGKQGDSVDVLDPQATEVQSLASSSGSTASTSSTYGDKKRFQNRHNQSTECTGAGIKRKRCQQLYKQWSHDESTEILKYMARSVKNGHLEKPSLDMYYTDMIRELNLQDCTSSTLQMKVSQLRRKYNKELKMRETWPTPTAMNFASRMSLQEELEAEFPLFRHSRDVWGEDDRGLSHVQADDDNYILLVASYEA